MVLMIPTLFHQNYFHKKNTQNKCYWGWVKMMKNK
jgi:hypothetical protein